LGRQVTFHKESFTLTLTGLTAYFAFKKKIIMPYELIENVWVDEFQAPQWMVRMPGTSISPLHIYEGSYKYGNEWFFLSFEGRQPLLMIELKGHKKYRYVIFQIDNPTYVAAELRRRIYQYNQDLSNT